jgi:hypothetical protein
MARRRATTPRDADLDERPFGDSHFGTVHRNCRDLGRSRASSRTIAPGKRSPSNDASAPSVYTWHEGCFEDVSPKAPRRPRQSVKAGPTAT